MTDHAKNNIRKSLLLMLLAVMGGYMLMAWSFPSSTSAQAIVTGKLQPKDLYDSNLLDRFYQERAMRTVWLRGYTDFQPRANGVLKILSDSWSHGLNPERYHVSQLKELSADLTGEKRAQFDLLMTDGVIRYTRDLTGMRGNSNPYERAARYWREPMDAKAILDQVALSADPVNKLYSLAPSGKLYLALRKELILLASHQSDPDDPIKIGSVLKPGRMDAAVPKLRERLGMANADPASKTYDDNLAAAVMKVQRQNGLEADGIIRADTLAALNRNNDAKISQIMANMERLRWMDQTRPDRYVLVNIPSASLWAVDKGEVALEMPVIVGKTARPTYSFKAEITGVRFNPNWTVPSTIKNADFLPALQQGSTVLAERGIRITYKGREVDPTKIDWSKITPHDLAQVKMIQNPGDDNPLGKVRVIMENPYNIYLHDTNHREMFVNEERTLSSGCIRVSQPEKLADFILSPNHGWSWNGMEKLIDSGHMRDVPTEQKMPVYITYQTIWLDSEGRLIYGRDVYGQDDKLYSLLKSSGGTHIPQPSEISQISL